MNLFSGLPLDEQPLHIKLRILYRSRPWTPSEDDLLREAASLHKDWHRVAERCKRPTASSCFFRWSHLRSIELRGVPFSAEEDSLLHDCIKNHGRALNWWMAEDYLPGRTKEECEKRWLEIEAERSDRIS